MFLQRTHTHTYTRADLPHKLACMILAVFVADIINEPGLCGSHAACHMYTVRTKAHTMADVKAAALLSGNDTYGW